jgi:hypothetical protein
MSECGSLYHHQFGCKQRQNVFCRSVYKCCDNVAVFSILLAICDFLSILISYCHTYACTKMNIAKVQDMQSGRDVGRVGDAVARRCKEDAQGRKNTIVQEGRVFLEGEKHVATKGLDTTTTWYNNLAKEILPQVMFLGLNCSLC